MLDLLQVQASEGDIQSVHEMMQRLGTGEKGENATRLKRLGRVRGHSPDLTWWRVDQGEGSIPSDLQGVTLT